MKILKDIFICLIVVLFTSSNLSVAVSSDEEAVKEELTALIGTQVWFTKTAAYKVDNGKLAEFFNNLEAITITEINFDKGVFLLQKGDGELVTWEVTGNSQNSVIIEMNQLFHKVFLLKNPYEEHPDWSKDVWDSLRKNQIKAGMTKEMVLYCIPWYEFNFSKSSEFKTKDSWTRYEFDINGNILPITYTFENNVLIGIDYAIPLHWPDLDYIKRF